MRPTHTIVLIGHRGSGKTIVGRLLAERLGWPFTDTDEVIQARLQRCISDIFRVEGEALFRRIESEVVAALPAKPLAVISIGGGAVESEQNRWCLAELGVIVWLTTSTEELHRRIAADPQSMRARPPLSDDDPLMEIRRTLSRRAPLYRSLAQHTINTTNLSPSLVVGEILKQLTETAA